MRRQPERERLHRLTVRTLGQVFVMWAKRAGLLPVLRELQRLSTVTHSAARLTMQTRCLPSA
jgi:hypothetical protein